MAGDFLGEHFRYNNLKLNLRAARLLNGVVSVVVAVNAVAGYVISTIERVLMERFHATFNSNF